MSPGVNGVASLGIQVGDVVGEKYVIDAVVGVGGMGVVFAARHTGLDAHVALKFLSRDGLLDSTAIGRFQREARAAAKLKSEHAARVFDVGTHTNGLPYIVMEYLEGRDLGRLLRERGRLPTATAVDVLLQTCEAIAEAHDRGIIHRDLKPSNLFCVFRADGRLRIKVLDFGISKLTETRASDDGVTLTDSFIGSPSYMSPEQMQAPSRVDLRTDIWSLGVVLYECLTGKLPFPATTFPEVCIRVTQEPPVPPRSHLPDIAASLEGIVLRCLEKNRDQRFDTVMELAKALHEFAGASAELALPPPLSTSTAGLSATNESARAPRTLSLAQPSWVRTAAAAGSRHRPLLLGLLALLVLVATLVTGLGVLGRLPLQREVSAALPSGFTGGDSSSGVAQASASALPMSSSSGPEVTPVPAPATALSSPEPSKALATATRPPKSVAVPPLATSASAAKKVRAERDARSPTWKR